MSGVAGAHLESVLETEIAEHLDLPHISYASAIDVSGGTLIVRQALDDREQVVTAMLPALVTALGGIVGYFLVAQLHDWLPFFLVIASSSFIYVALADLIPQLQKRLTAIQTAAQIAWLAAGIAAVTLVSGMAHAH